MTALMFENLKLILLFVLISSAIGLSHSGGRKVVPTREKRLRADGRPASAHL